MIVCPYFAVFIQDTIEAEELISQDNKVSRTALQGIYKKGHSL